nr:phospholipase domain-containing protein [Candidatus Burkholderia verschuerenii]
MPYELHTTAYLNANASAVSLEFSNGSSKSAGAVFRVYDRNHLDQVPRRYVVEAGKSITGAWTVPAADQGRYDFWVLGPNGYHCEFAGSLREVTAASNPEIQVC